MSLWYYLSSIVYSSFSLLVRGTYFCMLVSRHIHFSLRGVPHTLHHNTRMLVTRTCMSHNIYIAVAVVQ
jgi:hypothetical protein